MYPVNTLSPTASPVIMDKRYIKVSALGHTMTSPHSWSRRYFEDYT